MLTVIAVVLAFIFLDWPWRFAVIGPAAAFDLLEIVIWLRQRSKRSITGAESMIGTIGNALTDCRPEGQVKVKGQIWKAHCPEGVEAGDDVAVTGVDGIVLQVERARSVGDQG
jgi:membrane-bound serine protease (ClpP class)